MKLRRPCQHDLYDPHFTLLTVGDVTECPGGVFLPDDTLVIERTVDGDWPDWPGPALHWLLPISASAVLDDLFDALSVREAE